MKDGGPAFPAVIPVEHSDVQGKDYPNFTESGMSLRDWFAGQYLTTFATRRATSERPGEEEDVPKLIANRCYVIADAMLSEREKGGA